MLAQNRVNFLDWLRFLTQIFSCVGYPVDLSPFLEKTCCLVTKSCSTLCYPMDYSTPGSPVLHYLPEFSQIHVRWINHAHLILCCPFLLSLSVFPSIRIFSNESPSLHQEAKELELLLQHQSFQWIFGVDFQVWSCCPEVSQESSLAP